MNYKGKKGGQCKLYGEDDIYEVAIEIFRGRTLQEEVTARTMALKWERGVNVLEKRGSSMSTG